MMQRWLRKSLALVLGLLVLGRLAVAEGQDEQSKKFQFSGNSNPYVDTFNGYKLDIPEEFQIGDKGATTIWTGPVIDGGAVDISVNVVEMNGVSSKGMFDINLQSKKRDRNYTDTVPVRVKMGKKFAYAFRCKEAEHKPGTSDTKDGTDHHRWHLFVFGNNRVYTCGFAGTYAAYQTNEVQALFDKVIKSFELIPIK